MKKFVKVMIVILLLVGLAGLVGYNVYMRPDPHMQVQLEQQFGKEFFDLSDNNDEMGSNSAGSDEAVRRPDRVAAKDNVVKKIIGELAGAMGWASNTEAREPVLQPGPAAPDHSGIDSNTASGSVYLTESEIINKYQPIFESLQSQSNSRLEDLYISAVAEWEAGATDGEVDRSELARKYIQAGQMLEGSADSKFYSTLNAMKAELDANRLPNNIINDIESQYKKAKAQKRDELLRGLRI